MDVIGFFEGRVTLRGERQRASEMLEYIRQERMSCVRFWICEECFYLTVSERVVKRLMPFCEQEGISLYIVNRRGLPWLVCCYGKRTGLLAGGLTAAVLLYAASCVIWDVQITGNRLLGQGEIKEMLSECGLREGVYLGTFDNDKVESEMLLNHPEIGWIAVNVRGTTANVELVETVRGNNAPTDAADLIAACDGQIERIESYDGKVCVKVGDVVRKGEVLVSGLYEDVGRLRMTRAKGSIYARTVREFEVTVPLETVEKVHTGREWKEKYVNFFAKRIKVFANTGNVGGSCDIIKRNNSVKLPGGVSLPIGTETVCYREYREAPVILDAETAMECAFSELDDRLAQFVTESGAELLRKTVRYQMDDDAYRIRCTVMCIENIAQTRPIDIN